MGRLAEELQKSAAAMDGLAAWMDGLDAQTRVDEVRSLGPAAQRKLWVLTADTPITLADMVPDTVADLDVVRHYGRNTLPVFKLFEKRFCRAPETQETRGLWGYNEGSTRTFVGPGYFVCRTADGDPRGRVVIDYTLEPSAKPEGWPPLASNEKGVSRFVYGGMLDFMRKVSAHVTIGRAYRKGKETNNYFVLCREG